jgi:hypothetical protein
MGHLVYYAEWETPTTSIYLILFGDNLDIVLEIDYHSKQLIELENQKKEADILEQL